MDDGSSDGAVDVGVSGLDFIFPVGDLCGIEGVDAAGESEGRGVLDFDGLVQSVEGNDGEDGAEQFGVVNPGSGFDPGADAGRPEGGIGRIGLGGFEEPALPVIKLGETAKQIGGGFLDEGGDDVLVVGGGAHGEGFGCVAEAS